MRLSARHVDYMAFLVLKALKGNPHIGLRSPDGAVAIARTELLASLREEEELEKEALRMLAPHKERILREGGDFNRMLREGVRALAKKKGIVL